ncbi:MAG: hypothetical protein K2X81_22845 [Candidatus Obscuribacterales bacterium]|nr:hypothetical protein [Candidatus Obscuribacterales bacterium]
MNKHPMLSVKEAANLMGCDERWVRERLNQGQLKGEKKSIGLKDKWFVYAGEVEAAIAKRAGASLSSTDYLAAKPLQAAAEEARRTMDSETVVVETDWDDEEITDATNGDSDAARLVWLQSQREALVEVAEEMMRPILSQLEETNNQLKKKEEALQAATFQLGYAQGRMQEQEEKIKLLPDFQARAEKAAQLEQVAAESQAQMETLTLALAETEEKSLAEIKRLTDENMIQAKEVEILEIKASEATLLAEEVAQLKKTVEKLQQPWYRKWFGGGAD